jgi:uncharacterized protein YraI
MQALKHVECTAIVGKGVHSSDDRLSRSNIMRKLLTLGLASVLLAIPVAASAQEAYTTRSVNVRAGPDTSYPPVATLGGGAPVQVMGCLDDWSWCDVGFGYDRGWVYAPYLNYVYQGRRVPFYTYAPTFGIPIIAFSIGPYWDRYYRGRPWYGRRDYWQRREPQHYRPAGPEPRHFTEDRDGQRYRAQSGQYGYQGNREAGRDNRFPRDAGTVPQERRGYQGAPGTREGGAPPADRRAYQGAPGGAAPPQNRFPQDVRRATPAQQAGAAPAPNNAPQEMRRASPTQQAAPPPVHEGGPRGGEKGRGGEGDRGRGKDEGNKP